MSKGIGRTVLFVFFVLCVHICSYPELGQAQWARTFGTELDDYGMILPSVGDGYYLMMPEIEPPGGTGGHLLSLSKLHSTGMIQWTRKGFTTGIMTDLAFVSSGQTVSSSLAERETA
jgi:hypothetical protein